MSGFKSLWRLLVLCLPFIVISGLAVIGANAATTTPTTPTGQISTQTMSNFTSYPSGINALAAPNVPPLIMLVMSRDEQLFNKAYSDYSELSSTDTAPETTYTDTFTYNGYFDPTICYTYTGTPVSSKGSVNTTAPTSGYYQAAVSVNSGGHQCTSGNNYWSGNFLNWLAMSRLDILRWAFYGGMRMTDTPTRTILERAEIPMDLHSWAKVYSGSGTTAQPSTANLTPFTGTQTFCNVSIGTTGSWATPTTTTSGVSSVPVIRVAAGSWSDWAADAKLQCQNPGANGYDTSGDSARPNVTIKSYTARVLVCQNASSVPNESFCVTDGAALKPEGLLQKYSKGDSNEKRFGLVTSSAVKARGAGQLRRNIGMLAGNVSGTNCATGTGAGDGDEFNSNDGTFCYKDAGATPTEGIVYTLDHLQITGWQLESGSASSDANSYDYGVSASTTGCYGPKDPWGGRDSTIQATTTMCPDWGNPLASMYATALKYIQGSTASNQDTSGPLPNPVWVDPYGTATGSTSQRNQPCAACSIVLVSSGLNSFDYSPTVPSVSGLNPASLTNNIQTAEGISGQYELSVYYNTSTLTGAPNINTLTASGTAYSDISICAPATIGSLSAVTGICNGSPGEQGSYLLAGLSYGAWNAGKTAPIRTSGVNSNFQVATYGVSLSDNLPAFSIPVGTGSVSISPSCRADPESAGTYASCFLGSVAIGAQQTYNTTTAAGNNTYGLVPSTTDPNVGSYYFVWEDSQFGSDHDQDANNVISYCVGTSCELPSNVVRGGWAICDPVVISTTTIPISAGSYSAPYTLTSTGAGTSICNSSGQLNFTPGASDIVIRNQLTAFSSNGMRIGFEISGSNADGLYEFAFTNGGAQSSVSQDGAVFNCNLLGNVTCNSRPVLTHLTLGTGTAVSTLQTPLWYASKYSDFTGSAPSLPAGQDPPNYFFARNAGALKSELDSVFQSIVSSTANNFGNATTPSSSNDVVGNGLAYQVQYFLQRNGVNWTGSLRSFWSDSNGYQREGAIVSGNESLTSGADYVVSGPDTTSGAPAGARANWRCTVPPVPPAGSTTFDPSANSACSIVSATNALIPVWDAATLLDAYYDSTTSTGTTAIANIPVQRPYSADASTGTDYGMRYIFTYLTSTPNGANGTGTVTNGTQTDFVWNSASCSPTTGAYTLNSTSGFCGAYNSTTSSRTGNYGLLNEKSPTLAQNLVNWVRGLEDPTDYRSRTTTLTGVTATYRLGDIIDSSPVIVSTPAESFDLLYSDYSYAAFRTNYRNRRQMVYVGANDGMLHAFNGGFYVPGQAAVGTTPAVDPIDYRQLPSGLTSGDSSAPQGNNWALGQEAWAFVPDNLLPHLRWMADKNYTHVFYVDGTPVVSDVREWGAGSSAGCQSGTPAASDIDAQGHVCGWGTVMVVPFRLGGGLINVDTVGNGSESGAAANTQTSNSAYVILDITDPEQPPTVLGEITTGTYTTSAPAFAVHREHTDGKLHFLLTIGSGPADNGGPIATSTGSTSSGTSSEPVSAPVGGNLSVQIYDIASIVAQNSAPAMSFTNGPANSFAGDMVAADFNLNYSAEAVYFGVVTNPPPASTPPAAPVPQVYGGGLWKINMNTGPATNSDGSANPPDTSDPSSWTLTQVINTGQPVTIRPSVALDSSSRPMIYFGTGRAYTTTDDSGTSDAGIQQQDIYGVSDNSLLTGLASACRAMPSTSSLFDAASVNVGTSGAVTGLPTTGFAGVSTLSSLETSLTATVATGTNAGCYAYSGWYLPLAAGNSTSNVAQPSERVISSQTLLAGVLLTPTYVPPNAAQIAADDSTSCNPIPVPGISNLYGLDYLTGTATTSLAASFGGTSTAIVSFISLGSGMASSPVLHSSGGHVTAAFGISGGTELQSIGTLSTAANGEISWREPVENQ